MSLTSISKFKLLSGIQCPKRLFLEVYQPDLADIDKNIGGRLFHGRQVKEIARGLFPQGRLVGFTGDPSLALEETSYHLMQSPRVPLFEAAFEHQGLYVRSDILCMGTEGYRKGYRIIEVKASTQMRDHFLFDCAIQAWVIESEGYPLERFELAYVDKDFIYKGNDNYRQLFLYEDLTEAIIPVKERIPIWLQRCHSVISGNIPEIDMGAHCKRPFMCPFFAHCSPALPEYPVTCIPRGKKMAFSLLAEGIKDIRDIPEGRLTSPIQKRVHRTTITGEPEIDPQAGEYLRALPYPRYYVDFETIGFAAPLWESTRPYQQMPFQWSCHREDKPGSLGHVEFLDISGNPPMRPFAQALIEALGNEGPVFVYTNYEKKVLTELSSIFPDLAEQIAQIIQRLIDLHPIAQKYYYHPKMKGSWSIKALLPTIALDLDYKQLEEIQNGADAQAAYLEAIYRATTDKRRKEIRKRLLEYCRMDTLALVKLAWFFIKS